MWYISFVTKQNKKIHRFGTKEYITRTMVIGIILGAIFLALTLGGAFLSAFLWRKKSSKRWVPVIASVVCLLLFALLPFSFHTVEPGEVAVVKHLGKATAIRSSGTYFDFWITDQYARYDAKVQNLEIDANTYSKDAQTMDISLTVQFAIKQEKAIEIANQYGQLETLGNKIESVAEATTKSTLSSYSAMEIIENRAQISVIVEDEVKKNIDETFFVNIEKVVLTNIDFSDAFEQTVEDKMIAEQEKLKAEYEKETALVKAQQELEVAKLQAQARIEEARGDAESRLLAAQAEADALKATSIEVARALGFNIIETPLYEIDENGNEILTGVEYHIDFEGKSPEEIALIADYMKYIAYLESWDGKLPEVFLTENGSNLILPVRDSQN